MMMLRCDENRVRNRLYTAPFFRIPGWFGSPESQLSNHPGIIIPSVTDPVLVAALHHNTNVRGVVLCCYAATKTGSVTDCILNRF